MIHNLEKRCRNLFQATNGIKIEIAMFNENVFRHVQLNVLKKKAVIKVVIVDKYQNQKKKKNLKDTSVNHF